MNHNNDVFKTLDMIRYWSLTNGFHDWTSQVNDVIDRIIILERDLKDAKEELERLKIMIHK